MSLFSKIFIKRGNKIIVHKKDGRTKEVAFLNGLEVRFKGKNSTVEIWEPYNFVKKIGPNRSKICIYGDNNYISIKNNKRSIHSLRISGIKDNNNVQIGKDFFSTGNLHIEFGGCSNIDLKIGDECMFGQGVSLMLYDCHKILDVTTGKQINKPKTGISIGNRVWLARNVRVLKDVSIADDTVVATGSVVTKSFSENNVILAGVPAKVVKNNISWKV